jgi:uncharacterized protein YcnI
MSRLLRVLGSSLLFVGLWSGPSDAAVQLAPAESAAGSIVDLVFTVTNDRPEAFTSKVQIIFPSSPEFESATASAPAGWSSSVDALAGRVTSITYESGKVDGTNASDFTAAVTVPLVGDRAVFRVLQHYSDGQVVQWSADPLTDPGDPHPSPVLSIAGGATTTTTAAPTTTTVAPAQSESTAWSTPSTGKLFIGIGVAIIFTVVMRQRRLSKRETK